MYDSVKSIVVDDLIQALDLAGQMVQDAIERVNCYLPKMRPGLESHRQHYHPYLYSHFALITGKDDGRVVADYYAYLQSFVHDFEVSLPELASTAIATFKESGKAEAILHSHRHTGVVEMAEYLFIQHAEMNPYLCFMRGHLSAYTVVTLVVVNLQLALAYELLNSTVSFGRTALPTTYLNNIKEHLGLASEF